MVQQVLLLLVLILLCASLQDALLQQHCITGRPVARAAGMLPVASIQRIHPAKMTSSPLVHKDEIRLKPSSNKNVARQVLSVLLPAAVLLFSSPNAAFAGLNPIISSSLGTESSGFIQSFLLIFLSEIGDKTFFIAALLAAKYGKSVSFTGSIFALALMTVISVSIGQIFHAIPPSITQGIPFDDYVAVAAFLYFGTKTLYEAYIADEKSSSIEEEKAEAEELVSEVSMKKKKNTTIAAILQTFSLVFAAEIGDRSFLSTIALSAALNPFAVAGGAIAGHGVATALAVFGGTILSKYLSEKVIGYIGGTLFLIFALTTAIGLF